MGIQTEADVDSLMEQVSQAESKNKSPLKRRAGLTDEEMGEPVAFILLLLRSALPFAIHFCPVSAYELPFASYELPLYLSY